jgi:hypothetical protein
MAEPVLDQPRVMTGIGQGIAAGVAQHVDMNREADRGSLTQPLDVAIMRVGGERRSALRRKHIWPGRFALECRARRHGSMIPSLGTLTQRHARVFKKPKANSREWKRAPDRSGDFTTVAVGAVAAQFAPFCAVRSRKTEPRNRKLGRRSHRAAP